MNSLWINTIWRMVWNSILFPPAWWPQMCERVNITIQPFTLPGQWCVREHHHRKSAKASTIIQNRLLENRLTETLGHWVEPAIVHPGLSPNLMASPCHCPLEKKVHSHSTSQRPPSGRGIQPWIWENNEHTGAKDAAWGRNHVTNVPRRTHVIPCISRYRTDK
jgi:hypothetical protein